MSKLKKAAILELAKEYNVKFIRLQFSDIFGVFKNIAITVEELPKALEGKVRIDSSVIDQSKENKEVEICLIPDIESFVVFPWRPREGAVARFICDIAYPDGTPYECCSRTILKNSIDEAAAMGFRLEVGAATEFFLFHTDEQNNPTNTTHDKAGFCDLSPLDLGENARRDMVLNLEQMGFRISASHHQAAPGQHRILLKYDDALTMADRLVTFRFVVQTIAQRHSLHASFMPKPFNNMNGSGLHLYQRLYQDLDNAFWDETMPSGLSANALNYLAGLLEHACAVAALTNPIINSYKKLSGDVFSPTCVAWSRDSRNTVIRIPANSGAETGVEIRNPDPSCNPYLTLAVMFKSGLEGIKRQLMPPPPLDNADLELIKVRHNGAQLPRNLVEAVNLLEQDQFVISILGEKLAQKYLAAKKREWQRFENYVHDWERTEYL